MDGFRGRGAVLCPNTFTWSSSIVGWLARLLWWMGSEVVLSKHFHLVLVYSWVACQAALMDGFRGHAVQTLSLGPRL